MPLNFMVFLPFGERPSPLGRVVLIVAGRSDLSGHFVALKEARARLRIPA
jgi:hypothetical protein